jgi:hypothetical protein
MVFIIWSCCCITVRFPNKPSPVSKKLQHSHHHILMSVYICKAYFNYYFQKRSNIYILDSVSHGYIVLWEGCKYTDENLKYFQKRRHCLCISDGVYIHSILWVSISFIHSFIHGAEPFLRSCQLYRYSRTSHHFMEPEGSLQCSKKLSTSP